MEAYLIFCLYLFWESYLHILAIIQSFAANKKKPENLQESFRV